jgi:hypothetical protein
MAQHEATRASPVSAECMLPPATTATCSGRMRRAEVAARRIEADGERSPARIQADFHAFVVRVTKVLPKNP